MILIPCAQTGNLEYRCVTSRHLWAISRWLQAPAGPNRPQQASAGPSRPQQASAGLSRPQQVLRHTPEPLYVSLGSSVAEGLRATSNTVNICPCNLSLDQVIASSAKAFLSTQTTGSSENPFFFEVLLQYPSSLNAVYMASSLASISGK